MTVSDSQFQTVVNLADEYLARRRRGERASVTEYVDRYPELAGRIRELFPLSAMVDELASDARQHTDCRLGTEAAAESHSAPPPARLGDYRIVRELGQGGMGIVYEAEHILLRRHVALKVLHAGGGIAAGHRERFEREARAAAMLHHTNIVPVFDVGEQDGIIFYAMQFIRGQGLDKVLDDLHQVYRPDRDGSAPATRVAPGSSAVGLLKARGDSQFARSGMHYWRSVARIGIQVADALEYAHEHGTLHRDIKPSNLLLDARGVVWVTDFGLARIEDEAGLTQTGEFVGTLRYMAPERFEGQCDPRGDVYGLGLSLYELATFRPAFSASSRHRLIQQVTQEEPLRPRRANPAIPRDLETILLKAIAREPDRRYQTARELQTDLVRFVEDRPIKARRSGIFQRTLKWSKRRPLVAGLLAAVVLSTLVGLAGTTWQWREAERLAANERLALEETSRALDEKTRALEDTRRANRKAQYQLARLHEANGLRLLDRREWHHAALWLTEALAIDQRLASDGSADHKHRLDLGRRRLANLWRGSPNLVQLKSFPSYRSHALTDDGSLCITDEGHECLVWDVASGEELYPPLAGQLASPHAISPDGQRLLLFDQQGIRVYELRTGQLLATCEQRIPMLASWACHGERIVALNFEGVLRIWDAATGRPVGPERDLGSPPAIFRCLFAFAVSDDSERLAVAVPGRQVPIFDLRTGVLISECPTPSQATGVALSADGTQLAAQSAVLQVWDVDSGQETARFEVPFRDALGYLAAFSPDGKRIAFGDADGIVRVRHLASGDDMFPPLVHAAAIRSVAFSPDGQFLVTAAHDATVRLWDAATGLPVGPALRHDQSAVARFSADGGRIVTATRSGTMRIWETSSIGKPMTLTGHTARVTSARFSRDGRRVLTGSWDRTVRFWDVESGKPRLPPLETSDRVRSISLSADGRLILTGSADDRVQLWDAHTGAPAGHDDDSAGGDPVGDEGEPVEFSDIRLAEIGPAGRWLLLARDRRAAIFERGILFDDSRFVGLGSHWDRAIGAAFDAAGRRALVYSSFGSVHVVDAPTGEILLRRPPKQKTLFPDVVWAGFGTDDDEVLVSLTDGTVERWRISTARQIAAFRVSVEPAQVDFTRTGNRLVVAGRDHTVRVWDVAKGQPHTPPARHAGQILHVAFSGDGESFVTASADGTARVWDTATGQPITPFLRHAGAVRRAEFHPEGRQVVTAGDDRTVRLWPLAAAEERSVEELSRLAQIYSSRRIDPNAGSVPLTGRDLERLLQTLAADAL